MKSLRCFEFEMEHLPTCAQSHCVITSNFPLVQGEKKMYLMNKFSALPIVVCLHFVQNVAGSFCHAFPQGGNISVFL